MTYKTSTCLADMGIGRRLLIGSVLLTGFWASVAGIARAAETDSGYAAERQLVIDPEGVRGNWVTALDISHDRKWLAAADGKTVRVWKLDSRQLWSTLRGFQEPHGLLVGTINSVVFSPDGRFLIVGVSDNTKLGSTRVYSLNSPDRIHGLLPGHSGCTSGVAFSPDGRFLATWSCDGTMIVSRWNAEAGTTSDPFTVNLRYDPRTASNIEFAYFGFPSGSEFLIHCDGRSVQFVSTSQRRAIGNADPLPPKIRRYFLGTRDTVVDNGTSELNSPITGNLLRQEVLNRACPACAAKAVDRKLKQIQEENPHTIEKLLDVGSLFLGDNDHMTIAGSTVQLNERVSEYWIGVWKQPTGPPSLYYDRHRFFPTAVTVKTELGLAASADALGEIHIWNLNTMERIHRIRSGALPIYRVVWPYDSKRLLISTAPLPQNQYRYNVAGAITHQWNVQPRRIAKQAASVTGEANPVHMDRATGRRYHLRTSPGSGTLQLRESDANNRTVGETTFDIREFAFAGDGDTPTAFAFLPNANVMSDPAPILVGTQRGRLLQVGFRNGRLAVKRVFLGHDSVVSSISVSPDGRNFVSSSFDGTVRFWEISAPRTLGDLDAICWGNQVMEVPPGSEAARVGLIPGDKILSFDGLPFYERMKRMLDRDYRAGQNVEIRWLRDMNHREPVLAGQSRQEPGPTTALQNANVRLSEAPDYVEPNLSVFFSSGGEWVVWDAQGRYDASPNGERFIGFHLNGQRHEPANFHRAQQFQSVLYQPKLIDQKLRALGMRVETVTGQPTLAVAPESVPAAPNQLPDDLADIAPPLVRLTSPDRLFKTDEAEIVVEAEISTQSHLPVDSIRFAVNGHSPRTSYRVTRTYSRGDRVLMNVAQTIELEPGSNQIELVAAHDHAHSQTARMLIQRRAQRVATSVKPNLYVLAIGVSRYEREDLSLRYAHQDATDFVAACQTMNRGMYGEVECKLLTNENATSSKIRGAMGWMSRKANDPRDVAILYLAGHGAFDPWDEWFFAPYDIDPENLEQAAIYMNDFEPWLERKIGTSKKIALLDTCHAGGIQTHRNFQPFNKRGVDPWRQQQLMYIVSCVGEEQSIEHSDWKNGAFTEALLEALHTKAADSDNDGYLSFLEAELFLTRRVSQMTDERQHPSGKKPLNVSDPPLFSVPVAVSPHGPSALVTD
ncbi:WD40 repeat protein [Rhodopirellula rubra]|uniref:WD40 repeat protein n=1 Tax=Aporhodopirellula rubra TaxID=980271 RepID=A0A7W5E155_9BACT|nr:caspase family protein [Aporhodopirellula rubra]MBB3208278.1 WD40 repeat protein [Aporhodopirellula rubra]